ncbi:MAG: ribonuclease P protein component [Candidatus Magasanikbacteria bacterium]|nr:ribonuclease P protein component [Candidatus Magasanikbacteria bacterium]
MIGLSYITITKKRDFDLVAKRGFWVNSQSFSCKVLELAKNRSYFPKKVDPDKFVKQLKLAISTGVKFSKKAVVRNRARRLLREAIRLESVGQTLRPGLYLLFVPKITILTKNFADLRAEVKLFYKKINLF